MGADRHHQCFPRRSGQSLVEFVLILPLIVGMLILLIRVNSAIQVSIVNQKYSRQRLFELSANNANYPSVKRIRTTLQDRKDNRVVIGVSQEATGTSSNVEALAPTQWITRSKKAAAGASNEAQKEPAKRAEVRIRNTVEMCTPNLFAERSGSSSQILVQEGLDDGTFRRLTFCRGGQD
ncbi:pilus assembly protein [bacterium]|nr:pilus assembly protein [bacterium]